MLGGWVYMVNIVNTGIGYGSINLLLNIDVCDI